MYMHIAEYTEAFDNLLEQHWPLIPGLFFIASSLSDLTNKVEELEPATQEAALSLFLDLDCPSLSLSFSKIR